MMFISVVTAYHDVMMIWVMRIVSALSVLLVINAVTDIDSIFSWKDRARIPLKKISNSSWRQGYGKSSELIAKTLSTPRWRAISRSSSKEDIWLYERLFYGISGGIIVESGAGNGIKDSISYFYEYFANWTAVLIEPEARSYKELSENRTDAIAVHVGLCDVPRVLDFATSVHQHRHGFLEFMPASYRKRFHAHIMQDSISPQPCVPLQAVLDQLQVNRVDLWIVDTEGAEEVVLRGVDFSRVSIPVILIDAEFHTQLGSTSRFDYLREHGYSCRQVKSNVLCVHMDFQRSASNKLIFS